MNVTSNPDSPADSASADSTAQTQKARLLHNDMQDHLNPAVPKDRPGGGRISRTLVNFWLDALLAIVFVALGIVAVICQFVFPPGIAARGWTLWGMSYGQWCSVQFSLIAVLGFGVLVHVMLHWTWVCSVVAKRLLKTKEMPDDGIRTVYGVGLLIVLLLIGATSVGAAQWMILRPE